MPAREGAGDGLDGPSRAEWMPEVALDAADREPTGVVAEDGVDGPGFGDVVERGRGAVGVDVAETVPQAIERARSIEGLRGQIVIVGEQMGVWGKVKLVPIE